MMSLAASTLTSKPNACYRRPTKRMRHTMPCRCSAAERAPHIAVVGGGAAGLAAAYFAAESGARVTILEKNAEPGRKILISGGTRCNVIPASVDVTSDYFSESSNSALRSVFSRWSLEECRGWLENPSQIGIELALEEETGKLFPKSNEAREVRDRLIAACKRRGVEFLPSSAVISVQRSPSSQGWDCRVESAALSKKDGKEEESVFTADKVIMAMGGKSFSNLGTIGTGYEILKKLGHSLHDPYPALTPLLGHHPGSTDLPGVSIYNAQLSINLKDGTKKKKSQSRNQRKSRDAERTALLLTHRGFSGPAPMDVSHFVAMAQDRGQPMPELRMSWIRDMDRAAWEQALSDPAAMKGGATLVSSVLRRCGLPQRLAEALCEEAGLPTGRKLPELRKEERIKLLEVLTACVLDITGHEGYPKAEVTGGGVPLNEIDCATMESRIAPDVHICGELCDVHGRIGGFNFYWAWCSGRLAGLGAAAAEA